MNTQYTKFLAKFSLVALITASMILPSGVLVGIPVKYLLYIFCVVMLFAHWLRGAKIDSAYLFLFVAVLLFVAFFALVGSLHAAVPFYYVFSEGMIFVSTTTVTLLYLIGNSCKAIEDEEIVLSVFYGVLIFSLWKFIALMLVVFHIIPFEKLIYYLEKYAQCSPVTADMPGGFHRIALTGQDFVCAFFLYLIPVYPKLLSKISLFLRIVFMVTGTFAVVSSYSRYIFGFLAALWLYAFLFKFSFKKRVIACVIVAVILLLSLPWLIETFEARFTSLTAEQSDSIRYLQISALLDAWQELPILGGGLGYNAGNFTRDAYIYEVQWVSFLAKFGLIGISFLIFLLLLLFYKILAGKRSNDHYILAFALLCYVLCGFTNPILLSYISSIPYVLPLILASIFRKELLESLQSEKLEFPSTQNRFFTPTGKAVGAQ
ncbi:MAG: O-antigen ligase family protein [Betaproteobacteria bacterium]|nr:O-antigen ligase family protein [Betaproteobacteria bacterium]